MPVLGQGYQAYDCRNNEINKAPYRQAMINALAAGRAVSMSFTANNNGLFADHAYAVTGYESVSGVDQFTLRNPWGHTHPGVLTWDQLWSNAKIFFDVSGAFTNWYSGMGNHNGSADGVAASSTTAKADFTATDLSLAVNALDSLFDSDESFFGDDLGFEAGIFTPKAVDYVMRGSVRC